MLMRNSGWRWSGAVDLLMLAAISAVTLSACATWRIKPTAAGPGVPRISNLEIEPVKVSVGEAAKITFNFEDTDADIIEAHLFPSEVRDWVYTPAFAPKVLNLKSDTYGLAIGKIETSLKWDSEGIKVLEVFVVDEKNHTSNALRVRIAVIRR